MIGQAAQIIGVSTVYMRTLDGVLKPQRTSTGVRLYDPDAVTRFARERAARKAG